MVCVEPPISNSASVLLPPFRIKFPAPEPLGMMLLWVELLIQMVIALLASLPSALASMIVSPVYVLGEDSPRCRLAPLE